MSTKDDASYTDQKGRTRWRCNDEIAEKLRQLHDILVIGGYEESHATRYSRPSLHYFPPPGIGRGIASRRTFVGDLRCRLKRSPRLSASLSRQAHARSWRNSLSTHPKTVLELTVLPGVGIKTAKALYDGLGINSLASLGEALNDDRLEGFKLMKKRRRRGFGSTSARISNNSVAFLSTKRYLVCGYRIPQFLLIRNVAN